MHKILQEIDQIIRQKEEELNNVRDSYSEEVSEIESQYLTLITVVKEISRKAFISKELEVNFRSRIQSLNDLQEELKLRTFEFERAFKEQRKLTNIQTNEFAKKSSACRELEKEYLEEKKALENLEYENIFNSECPPFCL